MKQDSYALINQCSITISTMLQRYEPKTFIESQARENAAATFDKIIKDYLKAQEHGGIDNLIEVKKKWERSQQMALKL